MRSTVAVLAAAFALLQSCSAEATTGAMLEKRQVGLLGFLTGGEAFPTASSGISCANNNGFVGVNILAGTSCSSGGGASAMACGNNNGAVGINVLTTVNCQSQKDFEAAHPQSDNKA